MPLAFPEPCDPSQGSLVNVPDCSSTDTTTTSVANPANIPCFRLQSEVLTVTDPRRLCYITGSDS